MRKETLKEVVEHDIQVEVTDESDDLFRLHIFDSEGVKLFEFLVSRDKFDDLSDELNEAPSGPNVSHLSELEVGDEVLFDERVNALEVTEVLTEDDVEPRGFEIPVAQAELEGPQGGYIRFEEFEDGTILYTPYHSVEAEYRPKAPLQWA